jgi:hypothetical protein
MRGTRNVIREDREGELMLRVLEATVLWMGVEHLWNAKTSIGSRIPEDVWQIGKEKASEFVEAFEEPEGERTSPGKHEESHARHHHLQRV